MTREKALKVKATLLTLSLHSVLIGSVVFFGFTVPQEPEPEIVDAALVEMAKLGDVLPDPKQLVRIEASAPQPLEEAKDISLSRRVTAKKKPKKKPKKIKKTRKKKTKKKRKKPKKRKAKPKKRLSDLASLIEDEIDDERADEDNRRIGFKGGHASGRSQDPNALKLSYGFELSAALRSRLKVPEVITKRERQGLTTKVFFKISARGKVMVSQELSNLRPPTLRRCRTRRAQLFCRGSTLHSRCPKMQPTVNRS